MACWEPSAAAEHFQASFGEACITGPTVAYWLGVKYHENHEYEERIVHCTEHNRVEPVPPVLKLKCRSSSQLSSRSS
jgi:hypothetical protein